MPDPTIQPAYDAWAAVYDTNANATRDLDADVLRRQELPLRGARVLELGCGTAKNTVHLAAHAAHVTGLDLSEGMLAKARERLAATPGLAPVALLQHDLTRPWPIGDASIDLVVANLVLEHIDDVAFVYREAARVLRPGGALYLAEFHPARQLRGKGAKFAAAPGAPETRVVTYRHTIPEFVNAALAAGLILTRLDEWTEPGAPGDAPPRLLSLTLVTPRGPR